MLSGNAPEHKVDAFFLLIWARIEFWFYHIYCTIKTLYLMIFDWILQ